MEVFGIEKWEPEETLAPDWNVAPTKEVRVVLDRPVKDAPTQRPVRQLRVLKWGLVPSWAKNPDGAARMINARSETLAEKPSFHAALRPAPLHHPRRRLLRVGHRPRRAAAGGGGEKKRARKQPYFVLPADGSVFAMAGIYEFWRDRTLPDEHPLAWRVTCSVITTEAETGPLGVAPAEGPRSLSDIHPRMPLMLTPDRWDAWLDPANTDTEGSLRRLLEPPPGGLMRAYPVATAVSNVRNNGPELLEELAAPEEATLF